MYSRMSDIKKIGSKDDNINELFDPNEIKCLIKKPINYSRIGNLKRKIDDLRNYQNKQKRRRNKHDKEIVEELVCSVCSNIMDDLFQCENGHLYSRCCEQMLRNKCPICREEWKTYDDNNDDITRYILCCCTVNVIYLIIVIFIV